MSTNQARMMAVLCLVLAMGTAGHLVMLVKGAGDSGGGIGLNEPSNLIEGYADVTDLSTTNSLCFSTNLFICTPVYNIQFCGDNDETMMIIDWQDGVMNIEIPEGVERTEAADTMFKWLKQTMNSEYELVRRDEYDSQMKRLASWEKAAELKAVKRN